MRIVLHTLLAISLAALGSCGGDSGPAAFIVQVNSMDVVPTAVNSIELVLQPAELGHHFRMDPQAMYAGGQVVTHVSAAGEYVITLEQEYLDSHVERPPSGAVFTIDVPLQGADQNDDSVGDPILTVTFIRGTERIASGQRYLPWPLPAGGEVVATVTCIRPDFRLQCTNNDGTDAGTPAADAGPSPDAGSSPDAGPAPDGG